MSSAARIARTLSQRTGIFATRRGFRGSRWIGAPSSRRAPIAVIAALALIAALAFTAAPASADSAEMGTVSNVSYASADVTGTVTVDGFFASYNYEYSTNETSWSTGPGGFLFKGADQAVPKTIVNLKGDTHYFVRLKVGDVVSPEGPPYPDFTTLSVDPPSVLATDNASEVEYTTASVSGEISRPANPDPAFDVDCHFQYVTDAQFNATGFSKTGEALCEPDGNPSESPIHTAGPSKVTAKLTGLDPATTYHLRLFAANASPTTDAKEAAATFTTLTVDPPSVIAADDATEVGYSQASVSGEVERPAGADPIFNADCRFEFIPAADFGPRTEVQSVTIAADSGYFDLKLYGENFIPHGGTVPFNSTASIVQQRLESFNQVGPGNVTVTGGPGGSDTPYLVTFSGALANKDIPQIEAFVNNAPAFDAVTTITDGHAEGFESGGEASCEPENPISAEGPSKVSAELGGLAPGTLYRVQLSVSNAGGSDHKEAAPFTTLAPVPKPTVLATENATEVSYTTAEVKGQVKRPGVGDPFGADPALDTSCQFEYVTDQQLKDNEDASRPGFSGAASAGCEQGPFTTPGEEPSVSAQLTGLAPGTTYHLRLGATNVGGTDSKAAAATFTTDPVAVPTVVLDPITVNTDTTATFTGEVETNAPAILTPEAEAAFETQWHVSCAPACPELNPDGGAGTISAAEGSKAFSLDAAGLEPATSYEITLEASNAGGPATTLESFETTILPATIKAAEGASDGAGGYTLQGVVNPHNSVVECEFVYGPASAADPDDYPFAIPCSPAPGEVNKPVTVEGHVTGLEPNNEYHSRLVVKNAAATGVTADQKFTPTVNPTETCTNQNIRKENSSSALPECRAYEMVTPAGKEGFGAYFRGHFNGERILYISGAGNLVRSGANAVQENFYVSIRSNSGWKTIPDLNGSSGSLRDAPSNAVGGSLGVIPQAYSRDLLSSLWELHLRDGAPGQNVYLRNPDGSFSLIGVGKLGNPGRTLAGVSDDLSHIFVGATAVNPPFWGPGVYEFVGTGNDQPRRVDVDNAGSPITTCKYGTQDAKGYNAAAVFNSRDGRISVVRVAGGCGGANPPAEQIWARIDGTTSVHVSASNCTRIDCNAPSAAAFAGAAADGSRIFFTTTQQLVNGDIDETIDLYVCALPDGTPAPTVPANSCASLVEVSGAGTDADLDPAIFENQAFLRNPPIASISADGSTAYFIAKGVLASNKDAFGEGAQPGGHNLYIWRTDVVQPAGQTTFVGQLDSADLGTPQATPDGRYLIFSTASPLLDTDTDTARDVYRYDAESAALSRVSTNVLGVAGNGDDFDAATPTKSAVSDDGHRIVFTTSEALAPADGNGTPDLYLWTPSRVSLISTGASGYPVTSFGGVVRRPDAAITASGNDIYFESAQPLTPADGDDLIDVYDARIGGGFSFAQAAPCSGEFCQPDPTPAPPRKQPDSSLPDSKAQVPKCPRGKVRKHGKCVRKKRARKHSAKKHSGKRRGGKNVGHKRGGK